MLTVNDLSFSFQQRRLFEKVSFVLKPGELIHIKGSNGSGKTTLLRVLAELLAGHKGKIHNQFSKIEYLASEYNGLFLSLNARENLKFWQSLSLQDTTTIDDALNFWGLKGEYILSQYAVSKFSTGMKRRLALARAMLSSAQLYLLDEPANGLDQEGLKTCELWLKKILSENKSVIIVSHDEDFLKSIPSQTVSLT